MLRAFALFDFDGTVAAGDSFLPFLFYAHKRGVCGIGGLARAGVMGALYKLRVVDAKRAKEGALAFLRGMPSRDADALCEGFCRDVLSRRFFPEAVAEMTRLREAGAVTLLVSASPALYLEKLCALLPLDAVIATTLQTDADGRLTGRIVGDNVRGMRKPLALAAWLAARGDELDKASSWAFGDSAGDLPMLSLAAHAVAVNPKRALRRALAKPAVPRCEVRRWHV